MRRTPRASTAARAPLTPRLGCRIGADGRRREAAHKVHLLWNCATFARCCIAREREWGLRMPGRADSDESYVLDLVDGLLNEVGKRQHRFDWLVGDPDARGTRRRLPVDAYYENHALVVEYHERQHEHPVRHFDKPDRMTVSGVHRGEQRRLYDERRRDVIPRHGLSIRVIRSGDLAADSRGRLRRDRQADLAALTWILKEFL
jgi:hypothetical protein